MSRTVWKTLLIVALIAATVAVVYWIRSSATMRPLQFVATVAGLNGEFAEPFGIAVKGNGIYLSDGQNGKIWLVRGDTVTVFAEGLDTPSGIAFDNDGNLIVADSGSHTIRSIDSGGRVTLVAGVEGRYGSAEGATAVALFNAPIGVAVAEDGRIFVADTYNDRIRVIEDGKVSTLAGSLPGYADGTGPDAKFDTPCGIAVWKEKLLVADAGNRRIRVVEPDGRTWTLAGNGDFTLKDGLLLSSSFVEPTAIAVDANGTIIVADGNAIRQIGGNVIPVVRTVSDEIRGTHDGRLVRSRFNRPSGFAFDDTGDLFVADSDNRLVRRISTKRAGHEITSDNIEALREQPEAFRTLQPPRWPYDPPDTPRDIAGTLGELRGEIPPQKNPARFHNGLDIAGSYGETARFIRDEKVLEPIAVANFNTSRELIRMPSIGYVHLRLGRDASSKPFGDPRFRFERDATGKLTGVRMPRGTRFSAGEPVGTLNAMNHVHLIAGRSGFEMNALDTLILPGLTDTKPPVIEDISLVNVDDGSAPAQYKSSTFRLTRKTRIIMRAYDRMDGNADRRRLGIYKAGYQLLRRDRSPLIDVQWTLNFARNPPNDAVRFVYADGSYSGATGETVFNYIVTNRVDGDAFHEEYLDPATVESGLYILRVIAADHSGNQTYLDTQIEMKKL